MTTISVVTPTFRRPHEVAGLLANLGQQTVLPFELILVDGSPARERESEQWVAAVLDSLPYRCRYVSHGGGTAIQRNVGIDLAQGDFVAFIDDDIRLEPDFFATMLALYEQDGDQCVGAIAGYISNQHLDPQTSPRWQWYRRLRLFTTYEPGRFDFETGYPINRYLQPPHEGVKEIDFMGAGCAVWRRQVFDDGLRFSHFFADYGLIEDAHLALRAGRRWLLLECGRARCVHLRSPTARIDHRRSGRKSAVNYRYLFVDIVRNRSWHQEFRFWRVQLFDLLRITIFALRTGGKDNWLTALGKLEGIVAAVSVRPGQN